MCVCVCECVHAGRVLTEWDDVLIHMLSMCVCELVHFLFSDTNMAGTGTEG